MNDNTDRSDNNGIILCIVVLLTLLKLAGVISWSWWIILAPIWFPLAIFIALIIILLLFCDM